MNSCFFFIAMFNDAVPHQQILYVIECEMSGQFIITSFIFHSTAKPFNGGMFQHYHSRYLSAKDILGLSISGPAVFNLVPVIHMQGSFLLKIQFQS
jgi:hypothetical protein